VSRAETKHCQLGFNTGSTCITPHLEGLGEVLYAIFYDAVHRGNLLARVRGLAVGVGGGVELGLGAGYRKLQ